MTEPVREGRDCRKVFPADEKKHPWLPLLLEFYAVIGEGVDRAVGRKERKEGRGLACRRGCDACCRTQRDIPVYPHELTGIYWYCMEKIRQPTRDVLRHHLSRHGPGSPCPFVADGACVIHALRPTGCRQFNVFGHPCAEGEDPFHTRRKDVLTPDRAFTYRAFTLVLPLYGLDRGKPVDGGKKAAVARIIRTQAVNMQSYDWGKMLTRMRQIDDRDGI